MATVNVGIVQTQFVYCEDCNEAHEFSRLDMEKLVYVLYTCTQDGTSAADSLIKHGEPECLSRILEWAHDTEIYYEHVNGLVESRMWHQPVTCPNHDDEPGKHHHVDCHYYDDIDIPDWLRG